MWKHWNPKTTMDAPVCARKLERRHRRSARRQDTVDGISLGACTSSRTRIEVGRNSAKDALMVSVWNPMLSSRDSELIPTGISAPVQQQRPKVRQLNKTIEVCGVERSIGGTKNESCVSS
jgi:hypothetical protein